MTIYEKQTTPGCPPDWRDRYSEANMEFSEDMFTKLCIPYLKPDEGLWFCGCFLIASPGLNQKMTSQSYDLNSTVIW